MTASTSTKEVSYSLFTIACGPADEVPVDDINFDAEMNTPESSYDGSDEEYIDDPEDVSRNTY
jgi:hypothetical protein